MGPAEKKLLKSVGAAIAELRRRRGMNQINFGKLLEMNQSAVSRIESGFQRLSFYEATLVCRLFKITMTELVNWEVSVETADRK